MARRAKKVPKGFHPLSMMKEVKGIAAPTATMIVEPEMVATDLIGGKVAAYLVSGNYTWNFKYFKTLWGANNFARKLAKKYGLKVSLLS